MVVQEVHSLVFMGLRDRSKDATFFVMVNFAEAEACWGMECAVRKLIGGNFGALVAASMDTGRPWALKVCAMYARRVGLRLSKPVADKMRCRHE